jgi:pimeloyl-ACP methyl ester carboxylesterase
MSIFEAGSFWKNFRHETVAVDGVRLHYVEGGSGAPVLLIPGWPQSWYAWRLVMPLLAAAGRRVIAVDPRGIGDSDRPFSKYDMTTIATEIHGFSQALGLVAGTGPDVVGHDIGTWIGYSYASDWPGDVKRLALFDASLPGITPPPAGIPSAEVNVKTWHFAFNRLDDLPEILILGREREFLTWLFNSKAVKLWAIGPADLDEYVRVLSAPGAMRSALSYYRAAFSLDGLAQSQGRARRKLTMPVLALGAEYGIAQGLIDTLRPIAHDVRGGVIAGCGHYMPEEYPEEIVKELLRFFDTTDSLEV